MTAVPTPRTWTTTDALSTTNLNGYISDPLTFLLNRPAVMMRQTVAQTFTTGVWAGITCTSESLDDDPTGGIAHSTSTNTSRITAIYPGWYLVGGVGSWAFNATGRRGLRWSVNGTAVDGDAVIVPTQTGSGELAQPAASVLIYLNVGDYLELQAFQNSGGNLASGVSGGYYPSVMAIWERLAA